MTVTIIVKEEHAELLYKGSKNIIKITDENFKIDWSVYSNYVKGYLTVQIDYNYYLLLEEASQYEN